MKHILTLTAALALFAVPASAQYTNEPANDDINNRGGIIEGDPVERGDSGAMDLGSGMEVNNAKCDQAKYAGLDECKNLSEGRSSVDDKHDGQTTGGSDATDGAGANVGGDSPSGGGTSGPGSSD